MNDELIVQGDLTPTTLFGTNNPAEALSQMTEVATTLADVVRAQNLVVRIGQSEHVRVEGWTFLGSLLGVFPVVVWTHPVLRDDVQVGWEARVEARTRGGEVVGAAEAECLTDERTWKGRDDYARRSMAQTRAVSKALRLPLGFVMQLAGFNPTPAEEMGGTAVGDPAEGTPFSSGWENVPAQESAGEPKAGDGPVSQAAAPMAEPASPVVDRPPRYITVKQRERLFTIATKSGVAEATVRAIVVEHTGQDSTKKIPAGVAYDAIVEAIQNQAGSADGYFAARAAEVQGTGAA